MSGVRPGAGVSNPFCYGVRLYIEKSVWEKDKEKIIRLIESARVR